jgi:hypothetical protein
LAPGDPESWRKCIREKLTSTLQCDYQELDTDINIIQEVRSQALCRFIPRSTIAIEELEFIANNSKASKPLSNVFLVSRQITALN